jgi:PAS domain S-box-containing protein
MTPNASLDTTESPVSSHRAHLRDLRGLLQTVGSGGTLPEILSRVVEWIERVIPDRLGSVLLLDAEGLHLQQSAAPSLDPAYCMLIDNLPIGPRDGSCGTAAYTGEPVVVSDITVDPLWEKNRDVAAPFRMRACWSPPVLAFTGAVLGTFALHRMRPSLPTANEWDLLVDASHITVLLIKRTRADDVRRQSENDLRAILDHAPDLIVRLDAEGRFRYANSAMLVMLGVSASRIVGQRLAELEPMRSLHERLEAMMAAAAEQRTVQRDEFSVAAADGEHWLDTVVVPEQNEAGALTGCVVIARDSTARRAADVVRRRSEARMQRDFTMSGRSLALLDTSGRLQSVGDLAVETAASLAHAWSGPSSGSFPPSRAWRNRRSC